MSSSRHTVMVEKRSDHTAIVTLNRPEARNAVSVALTAELRISHSGNGS